MTNKQPTPLPPIARPVCCRTPGAASVSDIELTNLNELMLASLGLGGGGVGIGFAAIDKGSNRGLMG